MYVSGNQDSRIKDNKCWTLKLLTRSNFFGIRVIVISGIVKENIYF